MSDTIKVTLTQILAEIKTIEKRIEKLTREATFVDIGFAYPTSLSKREQEKKEELFRSTYQSINDLIKRRYELKAVLVETNAKNTVVIAGEEMTIAAAIDKKNSIKFHQNLLACMSKQKANADKAKQQHDDHLEKDLDQLRRTCVSSSSSQPMSATDIQAQVDAKRKESQRVLIDPLNLDLTLEKLRAHIDEFLSDVDTQLSIYDATTVVEIPR